MKIATHIFGLLGFLGAVSAQNGATQQTDATGLSNLWSLEDPTPDINASEQKVTLTYEISDDLEAGNVKYQVFTDVLCEANPQTPAFATALTSDAGLSFTGSFTQGEPVVTVNLKPAGLSTAGGSSYYSEESINGQVRAKIQFCVRFSLILPASQTAGEVEVNFQESIIIIFVDLTDGFSVTGISVAPKERLIRTSTQAYEVVASLCDTSTDVLNQGSVVCVNVVPEADAQTAGLLMRQIDSFTFKATVDGSEVTQPAVLNGSPVDLLTAHQSCLDKVTCTWSTILKAEFYEPLDTGDTSRAVTGDGVATMKFGVVATSGARRLGEDGRELQEEDGAGASEFDLNFDITPAAPVDESSAATVAYGLVAALLGLSMVV